jgi:hexosaminidase
MPLPRSLAPLPGLALSVGAPLRLRWGGVRTARLERALARWEPCWSPPGRGPGAGGDLDPAFDGPAVELVITCATAADAYPALGDDESYRLEIGAHRILVSAPAEWGVLRGLASLAQLTVGAETIPPLVIDDAPRFPWRGLTLDVARHFIGIEHLLQALDGMALCKLNVLHVHLCDDQAFRFPSVAYPRLASRRAYTRAELDRLVAFAADRGIRVMPELDMPGHTTSWLCAYPEWGCRPVVPSDRFGVHQACLDPSRPAVRAAVKTLLAELAECFPDRYLHFGGDEVNPTWWSEDPGVQAFMRAQGLASAGDLQAHFNREVVTEIERLGRRAMGWDEVLHPELPASVAVQSWRGATARDRALRGGHECVVSGNYYLDLFYPADVHYGFDPAAPEALLLAQEDALAADPRLLHVAEGMRWTRHWREAAEQPADERPPGRILGASACLWAELVDEQTLAIRLWSRLPAVAERFWSAADRMDVCDMRARLRVFWWQLADVMGVDIIAASQAFARRAGVQPAWLPLIEQLEPVKWYARLLGAEALAARLAGRELPLARPYRTDTPLDRVVDGLPPEAFANPALEHLCGRMLAGDESARAQLRGLAEQWAAIPHGGAGPAELEPLAQRLADLGARLRAHLDGELPAVAVLERLVELRAPVGEYLLAPVPVLSRWLGQRSE